MRSELSSLTIARVNATFSDSGVRRREEATVGSNQLSASKELLASRAHNC
jgi:hypothetical protein